MKRRRLNFDRQLLPLILKLWSSSAPGSPFPTFSLSLSLSPTLSLSLTLSDPTAFPSSCLSPWSDPFESIVVKTQKRLLTKYFAKLFFLFIKKIRSSTFLFEKRNGMKFQKHFSQQNVSNLVSAFLVFWKHPAYWSHAKAITCWWVEGLSWTWKARPSPSRWLGSTPAPWPPSESWFDWRLHQQQNKTLQKQAEKERSSESANDETVLRLLDRQKNELIGWRLVIFLSLVENK